MQKHGISHDTAHYILTNKRRRLDKDMVNIICTAAWCTHNDLFICQPDGTQIIDAAHPLQALKAKALSQLGDKLKKMTPAQIAAVDKFAEGLEKEE